MKERLTKNSESIAQARIKINSTQTRSRLQRKKIKWKKGSLENIAQYSTLNACSENSKRICTGTLVYSSNKKGKNGRNNK